MMKWDYMPCLVSLPVLSNRVIVFIWVQYVMMHYGMGVKGQVTEGWVLNMGSAIILSEQPT